jgi:hypothetical protein
MQDALPYWPAGLGLDLAPAFVGVGKTRFLEEVEAGIWHKPDMRGRRPIWCRAKLEKELAARYDSGGKVIDMAERLTR